MKEQFVRNKIVLVALLVVVVVCSAQVVGQKLQWHVHVDSRADRKWGFISAETGEWVVPPKYFDFDKSNGIFIEGYAIVGLKPENCTYDEYLYGFVHETGKEIVPPKYDEVGNFSNGYAWVYVSENKMCPRNTKKYGYGYIDGTGKEVIPLKYSNAKDFKNGYAWVKLDKKWGVIDKSEKVILPCKYDKFGEFQKDGYAEVETNYKKGLIDRTYKEVVPPKYDNICDFDANLNEVMDFEDGYSGVKLDNKWGLIDKSGKEIVPPKYNYPIAFADDGYANVSLNGVQYYIDKTGQVVDKRVVEEPRAKIAAEKAAIAEKERQERIRIEKEKQKERAIQAEKEKQELIKNTKHLLETTWKGRATVEGNWVDLTVKILSHETASIYAEFSNGQTDSDYGSYIYRSPTEISVHCQGSWAPCKIKGDTMVMTMGSRSKLDITLTKQTKSTSAKKKSKK